MKKGIVDAGVLTSTREEVDIIKKDGDGTFLVRKEGFGGHSGDGISGCEDKNCWWVDKEQITISTKSLN